MTDIQSSSDEYSGDLIASLKKDTSELNTEDSKLVNVLFRTEDEIERERVASTHKSNVLSTLSRMKSLLVASIAFIILSLSCVDTAFMMLGVSQPVYRFILRVVLFMCILAISEKL
jgi:hypothetical protein